MRELIMILYLYVEIFNMSEYDLKDYDLDKIKMK